MIFGICSGAGNNVRNLYGYPIAKTTALSNPGVGGTFCKSFRVRLTTTSPSWDSGYLTLAWSGGSYTVASPTQFSNVQSSVHKLCLDFTDSSCVTAVLP